ncbi:alpha/beta hydrolase [Streptomyces phaeolivaceus]|uniref:Alpha/beta hydrolase n=1 Tax=Streptomyces phaeolivaceus TaxID=2653200 RepID=A0A5P8KE94_9ACTN|nr:alpha/beta hydrolase [Streptomyces phaeolivaceus]QFR01654.1 alpha/beta hydrolase [Streptomyces phaeolivaceus]
MTTNPRRPPFDPDVAEALARMAEESANGTPWTMATTLRLDNLAELRELSKDAFGEDLNAFGAECEDFLIPGHLGDEIALSVYRRPGSSGPRPCVFNIHGGGMVIGDRFFGLSLALPWIKEHDAVVTTVEYRLAPEYPDPYPVEDCYAALEWVAEHAEEIGVDIGRLVLVGASAGGGLAAGTALLARDRGGPVPAGQMLLCPMLDDRDHTDSARQFEGLGVWNRESNRTGWAALLGERSGGPDVSVYAAPGRATDLSGLPPAFIDVGSAEVFRDEDVAYASRIWADGGVAELHVWPGGTHAWEELAPRGEMARQAATVRNSWLARLLAS